MGVSTFLIEYTKLQTETGDASAATLVVFKQILNDALHILCESNDWPWLEVRGSFDTVAAYNTGTVTVVDSTTDYVTTTGTWSTSWSPVRIRTQGGYDYLLTYNAGNSRWELDRNAGSFESAVTYTLYKDTYPLLARLRSLYLGWGTSVSEYPMGLISQNEMQVKRAWPLAPSTPVQKIAMVEPDATNLSPQAMVFPVPSVVETVHYRGYREVLDLSDAADTLPFPGTSTSGGPVLSTYRKLALSMAFKYRGQLERASYERHEYEQELGRLVNRSDPTANAQMAIRLDEQHFRPHFGSDDGFRDSYGYYW